MPDVTLVRIGQLIGKPSGGSDADADLVALDPRRPPALVTRLGDRGGNVLALPRRAAGGR